MVIVEREKLCKGGEKINPFLIFNDGDFGNRWNKLKSRGCWSLLKYFGHKNVGKNIIII